MGGHKMVSKFKHFPPQGYTDLTRTDVALLVPVLVNTHDNGEIRKLIDNLPSHLQSKYPKLATLCRAHHHLNPLPLTDLYNAIRSDMSGGLHLWFSYRTSTETTQMQRRCIDGVLAHPWQTLSTGCAACLLSHIGSNVELTAAVGSLLLAAISPINWKRSKRILWLEQCIRQRSISNADLVIRDMWQTGSELREVRTRDMTCSSSRPYIDKHIAKQIVTESRISDDRRATTDQPFHDDYVQDTAAVHKHPVANSGKANVFEDAFRGKKESVMMARPASSVYSPDVDAEVLDHPSPATPPDMVAHWRARESEIIDLYRSLEVPLTASSLDAQLPLATEPTEHYRHKPTNLTIRNSNYGSGADLAGPCTSRLWKRRAESQVHKWNNGTDGYEIAVAEAPECDDASEGASGWI